MAGSTVIFNQEYIDEVARRTEVARKKYEVENMPDVKEKLKTNYEAWDKKLSWAMDFSDRIDTVKNVDIPSLTVVKTMSGLEIPASNVQIV